MTATKSIDVLALHQTVMPAPLSWLQAPARVDCPHVLRFCALLHLTNNPVIVPVRPDLLHGDGPYPMGRRYDEVDNCRQAAEGDEEMGEEWTARLLEDAVQDGQHTESVLSF